MNRAVLRCLLQYGLGLGVLAWVVWSCWHMTTPRGEEVGLAAAWQRPWHLPLLAAGAVLSLVGILLTFVRWYVLVRAQDLPFTLHSAFRLGMIGYFCNLFLPGAVGGDLIKVVFIAREQRRRTVAVATVVLDRVVGIAGLFVLALVLGGAFWAFGALGTLAEHETAGPMLRTLYGTALVGVSVLVSAWLLLRLLPSAWGQWWQSLLLRVPRLGPFLGELWQSAWIYRGQGLVLLGTLLMSAGSHAIQVLAFYCAAATLLPHEEIPNLPSHFLLIPAGMTIQAPVPTPGGIGGGELIFGALYERCGFAFAAGVLSSLAYRLITSAWGLAGYFVYLRFRAHMAPHLPDPVPHESPEPASTGPGASPAEKAFNHGSHG